MQPEPLDELQHRRQVGEHLDRHHDLVAEAAAVQPIAVSEEAKQEVLTFVRRENGRPAARKDVRIVLHAKGSGFVGPQVVIDTPSSQPFDVAQDKLQLGSPFSCNECAKAVRFQLSLE